MTMRKNESKLRELIKCIGSKGKVPFWAFLIVRARPCVQDGVFRVPNNGLLETNKPLAMRVVGNALAYRKNLQCYNNAGSPTALQAEEVSIWI